mmetsp:Transcript_10531/g.22200  ORF Transcript_10531/g.22200 Transcript_10531/m.22200 type:complete len:256 (+) Transcript_10531:340-1107(+)
MGGSLGLYGTRVVPAHIEEFVLGQITEGSTGGGQDDASEAALGNTLEALENGAVLAIGGEEVDAVFFDEGVDDGSTTNECFLVGKGNVLLQFDGLDGGLESGGSDNTGDNRIRGINRGSRKDALVAVHDVGHLGDAGVLEVGFEFLCGFFCGHRDDLGVVLQDLFGHEFRVGTGRQGVDDEVVGASINDVQGLCTNGSGRSKEGESLLEGGALQGFFERELERSLAVDGSRGFDPSLTRSGTARYKVEIRGRRRR